MYGGGVFGFEGTITVVFLFAILVLEIFAFISALTYSSRAYEAADKLNKPAWLIILGLTAALNFIPLGSSMLFIAGIIAALVYLVDVRPALAYVSKGRR
jgi:hypothetical protein